MRASGLLLALAAVAIALFGKLFAPDLRVGDKRGVGPSSQRGGVASVAHEGRATASNKTGSVADGGKPDLHRDLQAEKAAFFNKHHIEITENSEKSANPPTLRFWASELNSGDATRAKRAFDLFAKASRINVGGPIIYNPITKKTNYTSDSEEEALIAAALFDWYREVAFGGPEGAGQRLFGFKTYLSILRGAIPYLADKDTSEQAMKILANFSMQMYSDKDASWWLDKFETSRLRKLLDGDPSWKFDAEP